MTIPNILTVGRVFLTPMVVWLVAGGWLTAALFLFFVAGMSDAFDGYLARKYNQKSRFGAYLDPLADKILLVSSFIVLWYIGLIPWWLLTVTTARDLMIMSGVLYLHFMGIQVEMRPLGVSKANTFFQLVTVFMLLGLNLVRLPSWIYSALFLVTAGLSIYSGWRYVQEGRAMLERPEQEARSKEQEAEGRSK